jgi:hypothetical protein
MCCANEFIFLIRLLKNNSSNLSQLSETQLGSSAGKLLFCEKKKFHQRLVLVFVEINSKKFVSFH